MPKEQLKAVLKVKNGQTFIENGHFRRAAWEFFVIEISLSFACSGLYECRSSLIVIEIALLLDVQRSLWAPRAGKRRSRHRDSSLYACGYLYGRRDRSSESIKPLVTQPLTTKPTECRKKRSSLENRQKETSVVWKKSSKVRFLTSRKVQFLTAEMTSGKVRFLTSKL